MKRFFACIILALAAGTAHAQGVGINTTGAAADTSAILDLASTNKGLLVPRLTTAQRAAIVLPATGLVVYQTDGTTGLYWNAGTPAAPSWKQVGEAGAGGGGGQWSTSGANIYYSAGKVAVGTTPTQFRFTVQDTGSVFRVQSNNPTGLMASLGGSGQVQVDAPGVPGGRLALLGNGNLGLGVVNPTNKLSFAPVLGKKISLYPGATGDVGFGVAGNRLQIYADSQNADVAIGYDAAGTFNERFAVKPNGALAVVGNTGAAGQVLQSGGSGAAATWVSPTAETYNNVYTAESSAALLVSANTTAALPSMSINFSTPRTSKIIIHVNVRAQDQVCALCGGSEAWVDIKVDGVNLRGISTSLGNGERDWMTATLTSTVAAGSHTVALTGTAGGKNITFGNNDIVQGNMMVVEVIPQ